MSFEFLSLSIPLWWLLVFYGIYLVFFFLYTGFNLYHLLRFGTYGIGLYAITALFLGGTIMLVALSFTLLSPFDWMTGVSVSSIFGDSKNTQFLPGF